MAETMVPQKVLDFVKRSGVVIAEAEKRAAHILEKQAAADKLIPAVVDALIKNDHIPEELRDKAASSLKDHAKTLEVLASVLAERNVAQLGAGVKTASARKSESYVGAMREDERESDQRLFERFGIR